MHVFVDTNIFIRVATQGRPGCEFAHFENLRKLVEDGTFTLVVPEVVILELMKAERTIPKEIESTCDKAKTDVGKAMKDVWSEIESVRSDVVALVEESKQDRVRTAESRLKSILEFIHSDAVTKLPLTPEILVAAKRRLIAGKMPDCKKRSDQDALIVESLASYFESATECDSMLFCTENTNDFGLKLKSDSLYLRFALFPDIQQSLPEAHFSTDLESLLSATRGFKDFPLPTDEEIDAAWSNLQRQEETGDDQWTEAYLRFDDLLNNGYVRQFESDVLPSLPDEVISIRKKLASAITNTLVECRKCKSWTERSEYKLPPRIEFVDEEMIPYTSIPQMIRIKNGVEDYLHVHQKMDAVKTEAES